MKSILMMVCGVLCVGGALLHGIGGLPALHNELGKANVNVHSELGQLLSMIWLFMSTTFATFGGIAITSGLKMRKQGSSGATMAIWVGGCLVIFFGVAMIEMGYNSHFFYFFAVGILMLVAALPGRKSAAS